MFKSTPKKRTLIIFAALSLLGAIALRLFPHGQIALPVSAKEYVENVQAELNSLAGQIHYYQGSFAKVEDLFGEAQNAFYEITTTRTYFDSVKDTEGDIHDLEQVLHQLDQLESKRKLEQPPVGVTDLANMLSEYYQTIRRPLELLLAHEQLQQSLLVASGDEFNRKLDRYGAVKDPQEYVNLIFDLEKLSQESIDRMEAVLLPDSERVLFESILQQHRWFATYFAQVAQLLRDEDPAFNTKIVTLNKELDANFKALSKEQKSIVQTWLDESPIQADFKVAATQETAIKAYLTNFLSAESSPTPTQLSPTPSPTSFASPAPSASPAPKNNPPGKGKK